jgi:D-3-phosphoglycerate dehydrogenase
VLNENKPGVIGAIGTILGRRSLNVSSVQLGLNRHSNVAVSVWNLDSLLAADAIAEIKGAPNVGRAISVRLD